MDSQKPAPSGPLRGGYRLCFILLEHVFNMLKRLGSSYKLEPAIKNFPAGNWKLVIGNW